jgi:hypothetical protein
LITRCVNNAHHCSKNTAQRFKADFKNLGGGLKNDRRLCFGGAIMDIKSNPVRSRTEEMIIGKTTYLAIHLTALGVILLTYRRLLVQYARHFQ